MRSHKISKMNSDRAFDAVIRIILVLITIIVAYPIYFVIIGSISDPGAVNAGETMLLPKGISLSSYKLLFGEAKIWIGYGNTIFYTFFGTLLALVLVIPAGYALSRSDMPFRNGIMKYFVFTMFFSGGLVPTYLVVDSLNLVNTRWVLVILGAVSVFHIILVRTYFMNTVPNELYEAALIDGCSNTYFFGKVVLPLSKAIIAVIALYVGVIHWNKYFDALIYVTRSDLFPLQLIVRDMLLSSQMAASDPSMNPEEIEELRKTTEMMKYSIIIVSSLPVLIIYPFLQKYFVRGVMIGAVKG